MILQYVEHSCQREWWVAGILNGCSAIGIIELITIRAKNIGRYLNELHASLTKCVLERGELHINDNSEDKFD